MTDVHSHFVPGWYVEEPRRHGHQVPDGMPGWPRWSVDEHLALMDRTGIERAILSISSPAVQFGDRATRVRNARRLNDDAAELCARHPARFGFFATLPLPDLDESLAELDRAIDTLGAAGATLLTRIDGAGIAAPEFAVLWQALGRHQAAVLLHPTAPIHAAPDDFPAPMMEFFFETARAVAALLFTDRLQSDAADARLIIPHSGGVIPVLLDRWEAFLAMRPGSQPESFRQATARLWWDLAGTPLPVQGELLTRRFGADRLLYGSDYCFTPPALVEAQVRSLDENRIPDLPDWRERVRRNAHALLDAGRGHAH